MSFSTISSARVLSLGLVVNNGEVDDVDEGVAGVVVDEFGADVC